MGSSGQPVESFWESSEGKFYDNTYVAGRGDIVHLGREMVENLNLEISKKKNSTECLNNGEFGGKTTKMSVALHSGECFKGKKRNGIQKHQEKLKVV